MIRENAEQVSDAAGPPEPLSARAAAAWLGVSERTIRRAIARGDLAATRSGTSYHIALADLRQYAERDDQPEALPAPPHLVVLPRAEPTTTLPAPLSSFVGRQADVTAVRARLGDPGVRLLTLTGPGGMGKTRLALEAAAGVTDAFRDGSIFVGLANVERADQVLPEIGRAVGLHDTQDHGLRARLTTYLSTKQLLLLLDNVEHVLAAAPLVAELAAEAPGITILATSRAPLRVRGEWEFAVPPLALPDAGEAITTAVLQASDAGQLFLERARARDPSFTVDDTTAPVVAAICARVDGLPLAIELAAARARVAPLRHMLAQMTPSLPFLTTGPRDAPERHQTLRNTIAWSYDLLSPAEQRLFRRLAVFVGGFTLEAAAWVAGDPRAPGSPAVLDLLDSLIDQSLLARVSGPDDQPRYRMLETVREFGLEQLAINGELATAEAAHAHAFLHLARELQPAVLVRATRAPLDRLSADHANLLAALTWLSAAGAAADFTGLVAALPSFWQASSRHHEGRQWLRRALAVSDAALPLDRARIEVGLAGLLTLQGRHAEADELLAYGLPLLRACGAPLDLSEALVWAGATENFAGNFDRADTLLQEALAEAELVDDPVLRAAVSANALANRGVSAQGLGDLERAAAHHQAASELYHRHGLDLGIPRSFADLGEVARARGDVSAAYQNYAAALRRADDVRDMRVITEALIGVGRCAASWRLARPATLLFAAAEAMRQHHGTGVLFPEDDALLAETVGALRQALGEAGFALAWVEGRALSVATAVAVAVAVGDMTARPAPAGPQLPEATFSPRELRVLACLVARRTNREIADELFLSSRTVQWYVSGIMSKLGVHSRHDAATRAVAAGLV